MSAQGNLRWLRSEIESASGLQVVIVVTVIEEPTCQPSEGGTNRVDGATETALSACIPESKRMQ